MKNLKSFFLTAVFAVLFVGGSFAQADLVSGEKSLAPQFSIEAPLSFTESGTIAVPITVEFEGKKEVVTIEKTVTNPTREILNNIIQQVTGDPNAEIVLPAKFNPIDSNSIFEWWMFLYGLGMPILIWAITKLFPSSTKKELIAKSTIMAIVVVMIIVGLQGVNMLTVGQAVLAFIFQAFSYDKGYKVIGLEGAKTDVYPKS